MKLLLLISLLTQISNAALGQVQLTDLNSYSLKENVFILEEDSALSIEQASTYFDEHKFTHQSLSDDNVNLGFTTYVYWLAIPVHNISHRSVSLEAGINKKGIYHLEYYFVSYPDKNIISKSIVSNNNDFYNRPVHSRHYYFPFTLGSGQQAVIFYRIDLRGDAFYVPLRLVTEQYRQQTEAAEGIFYAVFSGILTFVSFFSLVTFLWTRDRVYLFYSFYVASCCLFFLTEGDFDFKWLYRRWPQWTTIAPSMYGCAIVFFMLFFMADFLQLQATRRKLFVMSRMVAALVSILAIIIPVGHIAADDIAFRKLIYYYGSICFLTAFALTVFCIACRMHDKYRPAYLYGLALVSVFLAAVIFTLHSLSIIATSAISFNYILFGFLIEIFVLSFALIYSFDFHKKKHLQISQSYALQQLDFSYQLLQVQEAEKKRIAEDLHDELGGNLAAIKMNLQSLQLPDEIAAKIISLIDSASENARNIAHNLMPPEFAKTKLKDLLQDYFNQLNKGGITFKFYTTGLDEHFSKEDDLIIYRIIMELSNNITKHSKASEATIQMIYYDTCIEIMSEDNGKGFTVNNGRGMGMKDVQSRVNYLHGTMNIDSNEHGTAIIIKVPYKKQD